MPRNTLEDLNNHLFEQLERLNDGDLSDEELDRELKRADSMSKIAGQIIGNGHLALKAHEFAAEYGDARKATVLPAMLKAPENR